MRLFLLAAAAVALAAPVLAQAPATRQIGTATLSDIPPIPATVKDSVQRFQNYRGAEFRDWLADGSMLVSTRFGNTSQLHRVERPGGARTQLTFFAEPVANAATIPGTATFVISRDTGGDEWFQYYAMGLSGEPVSLTEPNTRNLGLTFSKDGRLMAWSRAVKGSADYAILVADPADPASRKLAYQGTGAINPAAISADGKTILIARSLSNRETRLSLLDLATSRVEALAFTTAPARYENARFIPDGRSILVITDHDSDVRRLVEINLETGKMTIVSAPGQWDVEAFDLSDDGRLLAYAVNQDGFSSLTLLERASGRALPRPNLPRGVLTNFGFSPDGRQVALSMTTARSAGDAWTLDVTSGALARWTTSELGGLDPARLAEPKLIRFKSFDGESIPAFVYRSTTAEAGARTPVIIDIHGGPESQSRPGWSPYAQHFADVLGATVILPNVRGSDGYGKRYLNLDNAAKREDSVKDIGALLDWIATQPGLDPRKVAVYGQSYGGYMSLASMTHYSDRLVGGVERYGISDFVTFLKNTEAYRRDNRRAEYGDQRDPAMLKAFARINPLANVAKITKPMLVMQGANDPRVPQSESEQVVAQLRQRGVPVGYVLFADEGHGFLKKPNNDLRREVETVFLAKLFGVEVR